ncbi:hypothetical protein PJ15_0903 [Acinetobacter sp. neg1]|uniref:RNA-directed DNA polymerase n=1 Tax=Acinetobacter sp. neg1 TaxID=1561068 RepID=UPI0005429D04|nr:RNA-directed DNA polymerase [Acinetobacter sp. neg1]KHF77847.1 hypothetical protein PJ15_0903 [Acinetobacter sp. neg1]
MPSPTFDHFKRASMEIAAHGDNDTLPFDIDTKFCGDKAKELAHIAFEFYDNLKKGPLKENSRKITALDVFSERLIAPSGPAGFRVITKIHPFWNIYFNGLGIAIAEKLEPLRSPRTFSYRFKSNGDTELFDSEYSWRKYKQTTIEKSLLSGTEAVVVQTDISSFYNQLSHHHIENFISDLGNNGSIVAKQINALLGKFSAGRSFGLPVGGQGSRILAELFLKYVDDAMTSAGIEWYRYVDDYVFIAKTYAEAYKALSTLAHSLANYGLTINKTKTVFLSAKNYVDYVSAQLGDHDEESSKLRTIDLRFDPYSDTPREDYETLKETVESLEIRRLLNRELEKSIPDSFLITQIGRTMRLQEPIVALELASTLLNVHNIHAFRSSWSTIMRGIFYLRSDKNFLSISAGIDNLIDQIIFNAAHLLEVDTNLLHFLRCLRFQNNPTRSKFIHDLYIQTNSETIKRACIDCWRYWHDRNAFTELRNKWSRLDKNSQRLLWLASYKFGDQGNGMRAQLKANSETSWLLGIENHELDGPQFSKVFLDWAAGAANAV